MIDVIIVVIVFDFCVVVEFMWCFCVFEFDV